MGPLKPYFFEFFSYFEIFKMLYKDRFDAANKLADELLPYKNDKNVVILAIPRGGVQIGFVISKKLNVPLDIIITKKIGYPGVSEYAIGAASLESVSFDKNVVREEHLEDYVKKETERIRNLLKEKYKIYQGNKAPLDIKNKIVIIVDDGVATGKTLDVSIDLVKKSKPKKIMLAAPVFSKSAFIRLRNKADEIVCPFIAEYFLGIGQFYSEFKQVEDEEVIKLLKEANE